MDKRKAAKVDRRKKIVDAAIKCFIKNGISQTKMNEIADTAGVDQPLIHYYFPTLDSLYADVVNEVLESLKNATFEAVSKTPDDPKKSLENYVRTPFLWAEKNQGLATIWLYFYYLASINPIFSRINTVIRETGRNRISVLIYSGMEKKVFNVKPGLTVNEVSLNIQGIMTGNTIMAGSEEHKNWKKFADETVKAVLALVTY